MTPAQPQVALTDDIDLLRPVDGEAAEQIDNRALCGKGSGARHGGNRSRRRTIRGQPVVQRRGTIGLIDQIRYAGAKRVGQFQLRARKRHIGTGAKKILRGVERDAARKSRVDLTLKNDGRFTLEAYFVEACGLQRGHREARVDRSIRRRRYITLAHHDVARERCTGCIGAGVAIGQGRHKAATCILRSPACCVDGAIQADTVGR